MNKVVLGALLVALGLAFSARPARALESTEGDKEAAIIGFGALDLALAAADLTAGARQQWRSRQYGAVEIIAAAAQVGLCLNKALPHVERSPWLFGAGVGGIFLGHGLATLFAPREAEQPPRPGVAGVAPVALDDPGRPPVAGLALFGRF